jgi:hypothetical protein
MSNRTAVGIVCIVTVALLSARPRQANPAASKSTLPNIKSAAEILDWSQDTTINHQKKNYLDCLYANTSN